MVEGKYYRRRCFCVLGIKGGKALHGIKNIAEEIKAFEQKKRRFYDTASYYKYGAYVV